MPGLTASAEIVGTSAAAFRGVNAGSAMMPPTKSPTASEPLMVPGPIDALPCVSEAMRVFGRTERRAVRRGSRTGRAWHRSGARGMKPLA